MILKTNISVELWSLKFLFFI